MAANKNLFRLDILNTMYGWRNKPAQFWQGGKIQDEAFLHWNELEQCEFDNWQGVMHDAQVNIEFEFASITSLLCGWEFLNFTTSKCISSVKFKNWKLDTDWYFVTGMFSEFDGSEVSCVTPPHPSAAPRCWWLVMIFTSWLYSSLSRRPACSKSPSLALTALATPPSSLAQLPNPHKTWVRPPYWDTDNIM